MGNKWDPPLFKTTPLFQKKKGQTSKIPSQFFKEKSFKLGGEHVLFTAKIYVHRQKQNNHANKVQK